MNLDDYNALLPFSKLEEGTTELATAYKAGMPWPHLVIDDLFDDFTLNAILEEFDKTTTDWREYETQYEKKMQLNRDEDFGPVTRAFMHNLNSAPFLRYLSNITGIERLVPDPYFEGGGYHQIPREGKLGVHVDFNWHDRLGLYRRLNLIIYLNKNWPDEYGGHFQLWDMKKRQCEKKVLPRFNRTAIFGTTPYSFHGHPEPLACPEGVFRRSLALYYYSPDAGEQSKDKHSTLFLGEDGSIDDLGARKSLVERLENKVKRAFG
jgi:hypothetical protein